MEVIQVPTLKTANINGFDPTLKRCDLIGYRWGDTILNDTVCDLAWWQVSGL